jgi:hypothetical protein
VTDLLVLAKGAEKITGADENRARSIAADKGGLFPEMRIETCDSGEPSGLAQSRLAFQPIHPALPWAKGAGIQEPESLFRSFPEFTALVELYVRRLTHLFA